MKIRFLLFFTFFLFFFLALFSLPALAQKPPAPVKPIYMKAVVLQIIKEGERKVGGDQNIFQQISVKVLDGPEKGKQLLIENGGKFNIISSQKVNVGETLILSKTQYQPGKINYAVADKYRLDMLFMVVFGFFVFVLLLSGKKGLGAIAGMFISLGVIIFFIVPQILSGSDPLLISIIGSIFIMLTSIYLAHGISQQTTVAIGATTISLIATALIAIGFVKLTQLTGLGSEDIYSLSQGFKYTINFKGLLLGGIIIGALGALDDVTTTQAATIYTLAKADPKSNFQTLVAQGLSIGREHIASLVNTLVLAYAGASIGVFIFIIISIQNNSQPLWLILNSEVLVEEIVRTLAGSIGLILAVPLTTVLAAFFAKYNLKIN